MTSLFNASLILLLAVRWADNCSIWYKRTCSYDIMTYYDIKDVHKLIKEEKHYTLYSSYSSSLSTPLSSSTSGTLIKSTLKIGNSRPAGGRASDLMTTNKKSCRVLPKSHQKPLQNTEPTGCLPDAQCRTGSRRTRSSTGYQLIALAFLLYNAPM